MQVQKLAIFVEGMERKEKQLLGTGENYKFQRSCPPTYHQPLTPPASILTSWTFFISQSPTSTVGSLTSRSEKTNLPSWPQL